MRTTRLPIERCDALAAPSAQGSGNALRVDSACFRIEFNRNPSLQQALYRYRYALMAQI